MANLPSNQAEVQKRIVDLEARLKMRGQRPEPDIPELGSVPSPIATQAVLSLCLSHLLRILRAARFVTPVSCTRCRYRHLLWEKLRVCG